MARTHIPAALRQRVVERAGARCEYCLLPAAWVAIPHHVDHILPLRHGGTSTENNLAYACFECNLDKGANIAALDPHDGQLTRLFNPRLDHWLEHFALENGHILGLDAVGRTTVHLLRFNEMARLTRRRLLIAAKAYVIQ
jgi:hypothetical protein